MLGVAQARDPHRMAGLIGRFHEQYPGVTLRIQQGNGTTPLDAVAEGKLDLALCGRPFIAPKGITPVTLARGRFVMACV